MLTLILRIVSEISNCYLMMSLFSNLFESWARHIKTHSRESSLWRTLPSLLCIVKVYRISLIVVFTIELTSTALHFCDCDFSSSAWTERSGVVFRTNVDMTQRKLTFSITIDMWLVSVAPILEVQFYTTFIPDSFDFPFLIARDWEPHLHTLFCHY